jgi:hypothetical protein
MIHRYAMLGLLTEKVIPGAVGTWRASAEQANTGELKPLAGKKCPRWNKP